MPTILAHAAVGWSLARLATAGSAPWLRRRGPDVALVLAMLPDADVVGFRFGVRYEDLLGHRGISHSLLFALATSAVAFAALRSLTPERRGLLSLGLGLFLAAVSHPLLDMLTDGGLGVAFFAPFSAERFFFPWSPIPVSPIGIGPGLVHVLKYEVLAFGPLVPLAWVVSRLCSRRLDKREVV